MRNAIENLLFHYLRLCPGERVIFIHDAAFNSVAATLRTIASEKGLQIHIHEIEYDGIQALDNTTARLLLGSDYPIVLFGVVHNIWHSPERRRAKYELKKRLAAFVCSPEDLGTGASLADECHIGAVTRQMKPFFVEGMAVKVTTPTGSDFSALVGKPFCEDGNYYLPGTGGDFPSGEVGFGPELGSVNGRIVYDVKVQHIGVLHGPLSLQVREDRICDVFGLAADQFSDVCAQRGDVINYISEISMGFNPLSRVSTTPAFIPEEKTFGTLHCGHGGNASYGNRVGPHIDGIMSKPTVIVGGRTLMQDGVLLPGFVDDESFEWLSRNE